MTDAASDAPFSAAPQEGTPGTGSLPAAPASGNSDRAQAGEQLPVEWKISDEPVPYPNALALMDQRVADIQAGRAGELIWLLEHPPLFTAGTSADTQDLLTPDRFPVYETGRGGQYTYHGPGQRIAYVMLDLNKRGRDIRCFVHNLEQWLISCLAEFAVQGERRDGRVGIWVPRGKTVTGTPREDKIAAIGVRVKRWVTMHGISLNVEPELEHFSGIVPCGIAQHGVTSLADLGHVVTTAEVDQALMQTFEGVFTEQLSCQALATN